MPDEEHSRTHQDKTYSANGAFIFDNHLYVVESQTLGIGLKDNSFLKSFSLHGLVSAETPEATRLVLNDNRGNEVVFTGKEESVQSLKQHLLNKQESEADNSQEHPASAEAWLQKIGVDTTPEERTQLASLLNEELKLRVGRAITRHLTDKQLNEFENINKTTDITGSDKAQGLEWLKQNYPDYPKIAQEQRYELEQAVLAANDKVAFIRQLGKASDSTARQ